MDAGTVFRTVGALVLVLGLLSSALWTVKRFNLRLPGRVGGGVAQGRLELVERTALDGRRSVALLRRDGREHLILLAPEGGLVIESGIVRDALDAQAQAERERQAQADRAARNAALASARAEVIAMQAVARQRTVALAKAAGQHVSSFIGQRSFAAMVEVARQAPPAATRRPSKRRSRRKAA